MRGSALTHDLDKGGHLRPLSAISAYFAANNVITASRQLRARTLEGRNSRYPFHISTYFPLSVTGFPLASFMVSSYVPLTKPRSPDFATSTLVAFQLMTRPGLASISCQIFRIASFVVAAAAFGG